MTAPKRKRGKAIELRPPGPPVFSMPKNGMAPERDERQQGLDPRRTPHALRPTPGTRL